MKILDDQHFQQVQTAIDRIARLDFEDTDLSDYSEQHWRAVSIQCKLNAQIALANLLQKPATDLLKVLGDYICALQLAGEMLEEYQEFVNEQGEEVPGFDWLIEEGRSRHRSANEEQQVKLIGDLLQFANPSSDAMAKLLAVLGEAKQQLHTALEETIAA